MKYIKVILVALFTLAVLAGCGESKQDESEKGKSSSSAAESPGELYVYNWTEYLPDEVIRLFEEETGIKVVYSTFESNEAMYAKLKLVGGQGYDLVVPSTYFVSKMACEGLLAPIDRSKLSNFDQLNPAVLGHSYDPANAFSVPYLWGGTGILYDSRKSGAVTSWKGLWEEKYKGKILLHDDLRDVFGVGLLLTGHSINSKNPEEIAEAYELLRQMAPGVLVYNSDNPKVPFLNEEVTLGMIWNGEAFTAQAESEYLTFVWPDEGGMLWMDNLVIPKGARNYDNALKFIDFLLRPEIAAMCSQEYGYPTANMGALKLLPKEIAENPVIFPPDEVLKRSEFQDDIGDALLVYEKYWDMLRTGQ